jgi:hypothetical protein
MPDYVDGEVNNDHYSHGLSGKLFIGLADLLA